MNIISAFAVSPQHLKYCTRRDNKVSNAANISLDREESCQKISQAMPLPLFITFITHFFSDTSPA